MQIAGQSLQTLKYFLGKNSKAYILIGVMSFIIALFESLSTAAIYPVLALASTATANDTGNKYLDTAISWTTAHFSISPLHIAVLLLFILTFVKLVLSYANTIFAWIISNKLVQKTRVELISSFLMTDYQYLVGAQKGDLAYRVLNAPGYIGKVINTVPMLAVAILKVLMIIAMLFLISPMVTLFLTLISLLYFMVTKTIAGNVSYGTGSGRAQSASKQSIHAINILGGFKSIRLYGVGRYWVHLFAEECRKFYDYALKDTVIGGIPKSLLELISISIICIMVIYFCGNENGIDKEIPVIGVFAFAMLRLMPALSQMSSLGMGFMADLPNAEAAYIAIKETSQYRNAHEGCEKLKGFTSKIEVRDLTFRYKDSNKSALKNINVDIQRGEFVGIIGPSGSGKTTILDILANLLQPTFGQVLLDGKPMSVYSSVSLSEHIGYVGQDPFLFNDTIRNNILFGRNSFGDNAVREALKKADILDFVQGLPEQLNFVLADDGMKISGGQRQRLIIARALLNNPEILLLDEATSALDSHTEANIMKPILRLVNEERKTVIFVTHRISAVNGADRIIEMRDGQVVSTKDGYIEGN